jgi:predicted NAD/FAD-dependent oxidoreductase
MFSEARFTQSIRKVAIVGSGLAGLTIGHELRDRGYQVSLFDKARGPGGRMSSKRAGEQSIDMGAQYFTIRHQGFRHFLESKAGNESWGIWEGHFQDRDETGLWRPSSREARHVGIPRMSAITRAMSRELDVSTRQRIIELSRTDSERWLITSEADGSLEREEHGEFDAVLLTAPVQQCRDLLNNSALASLADELNRPDFELQPCWAVALHFSGDAEFPTDGGKLEHPVLGWVANNSSKAGRQEEGEGQWLVLHATAEWSERNREASAEDVIREMTASFLDIIQAEQQPDQSLAHCWLYAKAGKAGAGSFWWPEHRLGVAGDWLNGGRVEAAWESATDLVGRLTGSAPDKSG